MIKYLIFKKLKYLCIKVFLNDIFVMELGSLNWINVKYLNEGVPESLCN